VIAAARRLAVRHPAHLALAALTAGLALAPAPPWAALATAATVTTALAAARSPGLALGCAALLLAGTAAGDARLRAIEAPAARLAAMGPTPVAATAHLLEPPRASRFGAAATVRIASGPLAGMRLYARAAGSARWPARARPGMVLRVRGLARPLRPGGEDRRGRPDGEPRFDFHAHLRREGVAGELSLRHVAATGRVRSGLAGALDRARERAEAALSAGLGPGEAALARGFILGQDEAVDPLLREDFRDAGLAHLLAVSGQNVMLLCALALPLLALAGAGIGVRVTVLLALISAYVPLAGAGPSLQRAAVMAGAGLVALAAGRPASRWYALLLAAAATLALRPRVSGDVGWQLSFAAVAGIALLAPPLRRAALALLEPLTRGRRLMRRLARAAADGIAMTVAATVATLPLLALHFGSVPVASVPANVAALPAVAPVMWIGMADAALGQLRPLPFAGQLAGAAARALALPFGALLRWIAAVAEWWAERVPAEPLRLAPWQAAVAYAALAALAVMLARRRAARGAGASVALSAALADPDTPLGRLRERWRRLPRATRAGARVAAVCAVAALVAGLARPPGPPDVLTVSFLDVGQGDATLVQHPRGGTLLVDGGPPEGRAVRLLRRAGVRRLDAVVATHAARDHHGGLAEVLAELPVRLLLDGGDGTADPSYRALLATARRRGVRIVPARAGLTLRAGALTIRVLSPPPRPPGPPPEDPNPRAVVTLVSAGGFDLLLSGDAESGTLLRLPLPDVEAMKVPHHGSADPGLPEVLRRARPEVAAIPVGENSYGHPAPSTLAALRAAVPRVARTDEDGTIRIEVAAGGYRVRTER
jgi:competence protein ComEC